MAAIGRSNRIVRTLGVLVIATCVASTGLLLVRSSMAAAEEGDLDALKTHWQSRYRKLRFEEARLVETVKLATKEYADSNRRTYRRSGVRHFHRTNANEAKKQLATVRTQIETIFSDVVAAGGSVNWLYEVDDAPIDPNRVEGVGVYENEGRFGGKGAYAPNVGDEANEDETYDDGRNPLYSDDGDGAEEDDPASINEGGFGPYDYEYWRTNREEYESERAPERHLENDDDN